MPVEALVLTTAARVSRMRMEYAPKHVRLPLKTIVEPDQHVTAKLISISVFSLTLSRLGPLF